MKKLVFVLVSMIILAVICIYVFIPGTINVSKIAISQALKMEQNECLPTNHHGLNGGLPKPAMVTTDIT